MSHAATAQTTSRGRYHPPSHPATVDLKEVIRSRGYDIAQPQQFDLLQSKRDRDVSLYYAGNLSLLQKSAVAIVGAREVSPEGMSRAFKVARELAQAGVLVVSGLAKGVDTAAHMGAIDVKGHTAAVIGTPINKAYPAENAPLQEEIYREHLLITTARRSENRCFKATSPSAIASWHWSPTRP